MITWKLGLPTEPGIYLRNNPAVMAVVRQDVGTLDGRLFVSTQDGGLIFFGYDRELDRRRSPAWAGLETFYWYGPIPKPPREEAKKT